LVRQGNQFSIWSGRVLHLRIHFVCSKKTTPADYSFQALRIFVHLERNFTKVYCFNHLAYNSLIEYENMLTLHFLSYHTILALKEGRPAWLHRRLFPTIYRIGRVDNPNHASRLFYKKTPELLEKSTHNPTLFEIFLPKKIFSFSEINPQPGLFSQVSFAKKSTIFIKIIM